MQVCGYIYDPEAGDPPRAKPGTAFEDLPDDWVAPCRARRYVREDIAFLKRWCKTFSVKIDERSTPI